MRKLSFVALVGAALTLACTDASGPATISQFSRQVTFDDFQQTVIDGAVRLEVELLPLTLTGPLVAEEVEIQEAEDLSDEEQLESRAVRFENLTQSGCGGTLVLAPDFRVAFDETTDFDGERDHEFEGDHREFAGADDQLTCAEFVTRVQEALDAGRSLVVEAERDAPATPQAPDDPTFVATELELEGEHRFEAPELTINVDADNLIACSTLGSAPDGCIGVLKILNVAIALVEDVTELESELPAARDEIEFEGVVTGVERMGESCVLGSVTLDDGVTVTLVAGTEIKDDDLCEVERAFLAGVAIEVEGEGLLEGADQRRIIATEVTFQPSPRTSR